MKETDPDHALTKEFGEKLGKEFEKLDEQYKDNEVYDDLLDLNLMITAIFDLLIEGDYVILSKKEYEKLKQPHF